MLETPNSLTLKNTKGEDRVADSNFVSQMVKSHLEL